MNLSEEIVQNKNWSNANRQSKSYFFRNNAANERFAGSTMAR